MLFKLTDIQTQRLAVEINLETGVEGTSVPK